MTEIVLDRVSVFYDVTTFLPRLRRPKSTSDKRIHTDNKQVGIYALKDVSLHLTQGDRLGIIGHNGAGKTTILRVMSGILPPTKGRVRTEGRVASMTSIQMGLNPYATGYENITLRGRYMGHTDSSIEQKFDDIAEFTELGEFLHLPFKSYSAGMKLRLAFAIATAFVPQIVILDEWLSAGDESFREKANQRMKQVIADSGIFVFASHNRAMLKEMCTRIIVMEKGQIVEDGSPKEMLGT